MLTGGKIVFASTASPYGTFDIWIADSPGLTNLVNLTPNTNFTNEIEPHLGSATSTASNYVVFRSDMHEPTYEIYRVRKNDPTDLQRLTFNTVPDQDPQWCGGNIIFIRDNLNKPVCNGDCQPPNCPKNPGTDFQIYLMGPNGDLPNSAAKELTCLHNADPGPCPPGVPGAGTPSPGTSRLFYEPTCHLNPLFEGGPAGPQVAFSYYIPAIYTNYRIGRAALCSSGCCVDNSSDDITTLTNSPDSIYNDYPSWNLTGDSIFFSSDRPSLVPGPQYGTIDTEIYAMEAQYGEPGPPVGPPAPAQQLTINSPPTCVGAFPTGCVRDEDSYVGPARVGAP